MGNSNQRRNERVPCDAAVAYEGSKGPVRGMCRKISIGGMFFLGATVPVGKSVNLTIELPGLGQINALGEVRYHHSYPEGVGMGLRFARITQEHRALLEQYLASASIPKGSDDDWK